MLLTVRDTNSAVEHTNHRHFQEQGPSFGKPVVDITAEGLGPHVKIYLKKSQQASQHLSICWAAPLPRPLGYSSHCSFSACHNRHHSYNNKFKHNECSSEFKYTLDFQTLKRHTDPQFEILFWGFFIYILNTKSSLWYFLLYLSSCLTYIIHVLRSCISDFIASSCHLWLCFPMLDTFDSL